MLFRSRAAGSGYPRPWSDVNLQVCGHEREHAGEQVMGVLQIALGDAKSAPAESRETVLSLFLPEQRVAAKRVLALAVVLDLDNEFISLFLIHIYVFFGSFSVFKYTCDNTVMC